MGAINDQGDGKITIEILQKNKIKKTEKTECAYPKRKMFLQDPTLIISKKNRQD